MRDNIKVSIITVCYNSDSTIKDTLVSVSTQTYNNIEHIIVDGLSTDKTLEFVDSMIKENKSVNYKFVSEKDNGIYDAMNKGISLASGDIIGILNSDDFFNSNDVVERIVSEFRNKSIEGVYTDLYYVNQKRPEIVVRHWKSKKFRKGSFFLGWHPPHPTLYLRREVYEKYGFFNLKFRLAADFELMLRLFEKYNINCKYLPFTTVRMRLGGATSVSLKNIIKGNIECFNSFKCNNLKVSYLYPLFRLTPKIKQFLSKN